MSPRKIHARRLVTDLAAFVEAFRRIDLPDRPPANPGERRTRAPMVSMDSSTRKAIAGLAVDDATWLRGRGACSPMP